ncbi:hypothetical protein MKX03_012198 [Papaver bracteatum]|nr:hypothetical protein MKX03_012198 [Papaver bracteatum]
MMDMLRFPVIHGGAVKSNVDSTQQKCCLWHLFQFGLLCSWFTWLLIPITETGINPARSFGAVVVYNKEKAWEYMGIFWFGPFVDAAFAAIYHQFVLRGGAARAYGSTRSLHVSFGTCRHLKNKCSCLVLKKAAEGEQR